MSPGFNVKSEILVSFKEIPMAHRQQLKTVGTAAAMAVWP